MLLFTLEDRLTRSVVQFIGDPPGRDSVLGLSRSTAPGWSSPPAPDTIKGHEPS